MYKKFKEPQAGKRDTQTIVVSEENQVYSTWTTGSRYSRAPLLTGVRCTRWNLEATMNISADGFRLSVLDFHNKLKTEGYKMVNPWVNTRPKNKLIFAPSFKTPRVSEEAEFEQESANFIKYHKLAAIGTIGPLARVKELEQKAREDRQKRKEELVRQMTKNWNKGF
jgi:hypothetical protein